jgi:SAM-dependent methyltransferase
LTKGVPVPALSDDKIWEQFLEWLPNAEIGSDPRAIHGQYRAHLLASGIPQVEADRCMAVISANLRTRSDGWRVMFNNIYSSQSRGYRTDPNALLMSAVAGRKPGRALDVGMGEGRNAVFLAMQGWDVTGFEISETGLAIAAKNAARAGVTLKALHESEERFDFGTAQWDLIVILYEPFPLTSTDYTARIHNALRPNGIVVVESFASDANAARRRPVDIDPTDLRRAFDRYRILFFEDTMGMPDWTDGETRLVRLVAERWSVE